LAVSAAAFEARGVVLRAARRQWRGHRDERDVFVRWRPRDAHRRRADARPRREHRGSDRTDPHQLHHDPELKLIHPQPTAERTIDMSESNDTNVTNSTTDAMEGPFNASLADISAVPESELINVTLDAVSITTSM